MIGSDVQTAQDINPYGWIDHALSTLHRAHWYRQPKTISSKPGTVIAVNGKSVLNFASNDYLGLAGDAHLIDAAIAATQRWGTGSTGSRLLSGHRPIHRALEEAIAQWKQTEDAIVFSSGYLANLGTIAALVGGRDLVLGDTYNHSSLKNGAKLSGATVLDYAHGDMAHLESLLQHHRHSYRRCLILSDSVFSMDGDICPLPELLAIANAYQCMLLLDEAHATGVLGATGAGCVEHFGCRDQPLIQMGTLSKALGSLGGYVAGSATLIDYLRNRAASWIYTTGLSPADTAAALAALQIIQQEPERRAQLWQNVQHLKTILQDFLGQSEGTDDDGHSKIIGKLLPSTSAIICIQIASPEEVLQISHQLMEAGFYVPAIRPPTVPTSRLRISLMATHAQSQIEQLMVALRHIMTSAKLSPTDAALLQQQ
jgi:8-amino-7-oxononanoate synthase